SATARIFRWYIPVPLRAERYELSFTTAQWWAVAMIVAMVAINYLGVRNAGRVQIVFTGLKVAAIVSIVVLGFTLGKTSVNHSTLLATPLPAGGLGAFLRALAPVIYAYYGFGALGTVGGEILNPQKNMPRAVIVGVLSVVGFYTFLNLAYFRVLGLSQVAQSKHVASDAVALLIGTNGAKWLTVAMMLSVLGALHANFLTGPRVSYAMARDGEFFRFAEKIQPVFHTPSGALAFQGCVAILLVLTGTYEELYSLAIFAIGLFFMLTAVALIRLRAKEPALPRPYLAWGYPFTPLVFAAGALAMSVNLWIVRPMR